MWHPWQSVSVCGEWMSAFMTVCSQHILLRKTCFHLTCENRNSTCKKLTFTKGIAFSHVKNELHVKITFSVSYERKHMELQVPKWKTIMWKSNLQLQMWEKLTCENLTFTYTVYTVIASSHVVVK
jgi:hypothetical protein